MNLADAAAFIASSLSPSRVTSVTITDEGTRSARVVVPDYQLSLAIGSSALSLGVLLATFMGGLSAGSLLATRGTLRSPLRRYAAIELAIPLDVRSQAGRQATDDDFEGPAERVSGRARGVDRLDHLLLPHVIDAMQRRIVVQPSDLLVGEGERIADGHRAECEHVADDVDVEGGQELTGQCTGGDARRRLAGAGALEDVAHVLAVVFQRAREVSVARYVDGEWESVRGGSGGDPVDLTQYLHPG